MRLFKRRGLRELGELECYARCHGERGNEVRVVAAVPRRRRYAVTMTGEEMRRDFERRMRARTEAGAEHASSGAWPLDE